MKRINIDAATSAVREFVRALSTEADGVELELDGKVVCEVLPAHSLSAAERAALIARGRELSRRARARNQGVPSRTIEREIGDAIDEVRRRKRS